MELLLMIDAQKNSAYKIIAVILFRLASKMKDKPRVSIGAKLIADYSVAALTG